MENDSALDRERSAGIRLMAVNGSEPAFSFVGTERFCSTNDCCDGACNGAGRRIRTDDLLITNQNVFLA
jgi:hypothetical protein